MNQEGKTPAGLVLLSVFNFGLSGLLIFMFGMMHIARGVERVGNPIPSVWILILAGAMIMNAVGMLTRKVLTGYCLGVLLGGGSLIAITCWTDPSDPLRWFYISYPIVFLVVLNLNLKHFLRGRGRAEPAH